MSGEHFLNDLVCRLAYALDPSLPPSPLPNASGWYGRLAPPFAPPLLGPSPLFGLENMITSIARACQWREKLTQTGAPHSSMRRSSSTSPIATSVARLRVV